MSASASASNHFKVLIIGAGASGVAAAARLLDSGFADFKILEAESRIGGRINTTHWGNTTIEIGAEWVHGQIGNVVYELGSKYDLIEVDKADFTKATYYDSSGNKINKDISEALAAASYEIIEDTKELNENKLVGSLGSYFDVEFQKTVEELRKKVNIDSGLCEKFKKSFELWENSIDGSESWYKTSLKGHLDYWECDGAHLSMWKNHRYDVLFDLLIREIPNSENEHPISSRIIFNKEVVNINWNKDCNPKVPNVKVKCLDGSEYSADNIMITCSLGVLKERVSEMFSPPLPSEKLKCIKNLGFGVVDKIFVKFDHRWWGDDLSGYCFLWSEEERKNDSSRWLNGVICFHPIHSESTILRGWITGEAARVMETLSSEEILKGINYLFDKFLRPTLEVPLIEICVTSRWFTNPHFRGSYSCRYIESEDCDVWASQLAESVCNTNGQPVLFFGGEATHEHYFSTVHGAVEAGRREAGKLLKRVMGEGVTSECFQVAIVGAGISGLAAAKTLLENDVRDIIILEAQSVPGGRISTLQMEDCNLELGAQWIHGDKNEVFNISCENALITDEYSSEGEGLYFRENGEEVDEKLVKDVDDIVKTILEDCEVYAQSNEKISHSVGEELMKKFDEYLERCEEDTEEVRKVKKDLFRWHIMFQLIDNSCADLFNLSAKAWGLFRFCGGNDYINFKNGYGSVVSAIVNSFPENILRCSTPVERIDWAKEIDATQQNSPNHSVKITISNGDTLYSQYVIVTSSLGYLKKNHNSFFSPPLPEYLSKAIELLGFGVMDKIFLIYEKPWWDNDVKGFQLVWSNETDEPNHHWGRFMTGFDVIIKDKPILLGWIGGDGAEKVELIPEEEIGRQATEILRKFVRNKEIPLPKKVVRTQWRSNEYVRGAYSHITMECDEEEIRCSSLAQPAYTDVHTNTKTFRKPTILLAGESAHGSHFSTVHGAFESGQSQARVILDHMRSEPK